MLSLLTIVALQGRRSSTRRSIPPLARAPRESAVVRPLGPRTGDVGGVPEPPCEWADETRFPGVAARDRRRGPPGRRHGRRARLQPRHPADPLQPLLQVPRARRGKPGGRPAARPPRGGDPGARQRRAGDRAGPCRRERTRRPDHERRPRPRDAAAAHEGLALGR